MFPQQVEALVKGTPAPEPKPAPAKPATTTVTSPAPSNAAVASRQQMVLTIDGQRHEVCVEKLEA